MKPLVDRLRERIDVVTDERDQARDEIVRLRSQMNDFAREHPGLHFARTGICRVYATEEERLEARRRTWRNSKRKAAAEKEGVNP